MQRCRKQTGTGSCGLDGAVNVIGEGRPRLEGLEIGPRIRPLNRFGRTMNTGWPEFSLSVVCKREIDLGGWFALCKSKPESE